MTDKLTDNEIIKALECCYTTENPWENPCKNCPLCDVEECNDVLMAEYVKDLINRLQAQNKDLAETVHNLTLEKDALFDKLEELKAEVEKLNALIKTKNKLIKGLDQSISYAYDRAIEEFAERLKEKSFQSFGNYGITRDVVEVCDIDNLVKEMVGDDND